MTANSDDTTDYGPSPQRPPAPRPSPPAERAVVDIAARSHAGLVRTNNEDIYLTVCFGRNLQTLETNLPAGCVPIHYDDTGYGLLVADGIGGVAGGEVASRMAVSTLIQMVLDTPDWFLKIGEREADEVLTRMAQRYREIHATLKAEGEANPELTGMGTTMTVACNMGRDLFLGHVGDSRVYICRGADVHQLTRDHTYAQELADMGLLAPDEVRTHRFRHVLTRALGEMSHNVEADVQQVRLSDQDQVLLCTDGLTDLVDDATIGATMQKSATAAAACDALVDLALKNGGRDNVTVALARYHFLREN